MSLISENGSKLNKKLMAVSKLEQVKHAFLLALPKSHLLHIPNKSMSPVSSLKLGLTFLPSHFGHADAERGVASMQRLKATGNIPGFIFLALILCKG